MWIREITNGEEKKNTTVPFLLIFREDVPFFFPLHDLPKIIERDRFRKAFFFSSKKHVENYEISPDSLERS